MSKCFENLNLVAYALSTINNTYGTEKRQAFLRNVGFMGLKLYFSYKRKEMIR